MPASASMTPAPAHGRRSVPSGVGVGAENSVGIEAACSTPTARGFRCDLVNDAVAPAVCAHLRVDSAPQFTNGYARVRWNSANVRGAVRELGESLDEWSPRRPPHQRLDDPGIVTQAPAAARIAAIVEEGNRSVLDTRRTT